MIFSAEDAQYYTNIIDVDGSLKIFANSRDFGCIESH